MKVRELVQVLNNLPQETEIKCSNNFLNDIGIMCDFIKMTRQEFFQKYFYMTSVQYDITSSLFYNDKFNYLTNMYNRMCEIDVNKVLYQTKVLENEIKKMQQKRGRNGYNIF